MSEQLTVDGQILVSLRPDEKGRPQPHYEWRGGDTVVVDRDMVLAEMAKRGLRPVKGLREGSTVYVGPFTLTVLAQHWASESYICRREGKR